MGGVKVENVANRILQLGDNNFSSGKITLAANTTLVAGAILKRGAGPNEFEVAAANSEYAAVNPFDIENDTAASKTFGFRALMDGRVREDMLRIGANKVAVADVDKLRKIGILPVKVTDLSQLDNQ